MDKLLLTLALTATHYLFVYFTGNAPEKEQVCYAVSDDGFNYSPLNNGLPIIGSDTIARAKGVRDPHILRCDDGWFRMTVTDMRCRQGWDSNRGIVLLRSRDMVHWEHHTVHFPERFAGTPFAHVTRVWAPQTFFDQHTGRYLVYFSLLSSDGTIPYDRVYWCYANSDFTDLEGVPQVLFDFGSPAIDSDIVRDERPVARQLRYSILRYMQSPDFLPAVTLSVDVIRHLYERKAPAVNMFTRESPDELKPKLNN